MWRWGDRGIGSSVDEGGRPKGIIKDHLTGDKISKIPIFRELLSSKQK